MRLLRSMMFTPGNRPRFVAKAASAGADAIILDLEDSIPIAEKVATRPIVRQAIDDLVAAGQRQVYVRVNPLGANKTAYSQDLAAGDVAAVLCPDLTGIVLPKVEAAEEILELDRLMGELERAQGIPEGQVELNPILETAKGIMNAPQIAAACPRRVPRLAIGAGDLTHDLGIGWTQDETELLFARSWVVMVSRAAGIEPPIDGVYATLADAEGQAHSAKIAKQLGFQGKQCIHPQQVPLLNAIFGPSAEQIDYARRAIAAFDQAVSEGKASILFEGKMLDYPVVERERELLARAEEIARRAK